MELVQSNIRAGIELGTFPAPVEAEAFRLPMTFESLGEQLQSFKGRALCDLVRYRKGGNCDAIVDEVQVGQAFYVVSKCGYSPPSGQVQLSMRVANAKADKFPASSRKGRGIRVRAEDNTQPTNRVPGDRINRLSLVY
ncbi:hypothetical protein H4582DRAFT_2065290 [Lactarius indigo]|nr:hypothetical protein H4582DRAFT_2065290 [Lactarius indigo]